MNKIIFKIACLIWLFQRGLFYRDLADAFRRESTLKEFLERELTNARMVKAGVRTIVMQHLVNRFATGQALTLSELMRKVVPASDLMLLTAVDDALVKPNALESAADAVDFQVRSLKILGSNLAIPAVSLPVVAVICLVSADVIALIAKSAPPEIWVGFNGGVRFVAESVNDYLVHALIALTVFVVLFVLSLPRWTGRLRLKVDNIPGFSLYRDYNAAVVLSALAMMMGAKKPLVESLEDLKQAGSPWLRWHIQRILFSLDDNPNDYSSAFSRGLMPVVVRSRLATLMDSSKSFDAALIMLGSAEVKRLESSVRISAELLNWTLVSILASLAVYLSIGQLTITTALANETSISKIMQRK